MPRPITSHVPGQCLVVNEAHQHCQRWAAPGTGFCGQFRYSPRYFRSTVRAWAYTQGVTPAALREEATAALLDSHLADPYAVSQAAEWLARPPDPEAPAP